MAVLPTTNISTTSVRNTLGEDNNDVGLLCKSAKINMWSKRKPVRYPADFIADPNDVGKTLDYKWGLALPVFTGRTSDGTLDDRRTVYNRPNGGSSQPYRLGDFRGYNHNAKIPLEIPPRPIDQPIYRQPFTISAIATMDDLDSLTLLDFGLRLGCYVYEHDGEFLGSASASSDGGVDIAIDLTNRVNVNYVDVYFLLTDTYKEWGTGGISTRYEPFRPEESGHQISVNSDWIGIPLNTPSSGYPQITDFNIIHKPRLQQIDIMVRTYLWAAPPVGTNGDLFVQITHIENGNPTPDANITLNITQVNTIVTFTRSATWIVPGRVYTAMIWMGDSMSGARDNECSFVAMMEA